MNSKSLEAELINQRLLDLYGLSQYVEQQRFRLVWSNDQTEKVEDDWEDWQGPIYLRTVHEIRETVKYPWLSNQWVLEVLVPNDNPSIIEGSYIYNCLYAFPINFPPKWEACLVVVRKYLDLDNTRKKRTRYDVIQEDEKKRKKEYEEIKNLLDVTSTEIALRHGSGVSLTGAYKKVVS